MLSEQNADLVLQFYKAFDDRKIEQAIELLGSNFVAHLAGVPDPLDAEEFKNFGMSFYRAFRQGNHVFEQVIVSGDTVVTCGTFSATHLGEFQGLPPTGQRINLTVMHIDRVENGKIVEHWGQGDALSLMRQLGIVFLPGPKLLPSILRSAASKLINRPSP